MEALLDWMAANPQVWAWFTTAVRFLFPVLALLILIRTIRSLLTVPCLPEVWAYLTLPNGAQEPLTHWENILGRGGNSDVILNYPVVSRQHAALIRQADDTWTAYDLGSKGGVTVNGRPVEGSAPVQYGDVVGIGGVETVLLPLSPEEKAQRRQRRRAWRPVSPWLGLVLLTVFQALTALQLTISEGENATVMIPLTFLLLTGVMWLYFLTLRALRRVGFEMETIAFFLSTLSLAVTSSSNTPALFKQFLCVVLGLALFLVLGVFLRNLDRAKKIRWLMAAGAIGLLSLTVVLYLLGLTGTKYGAANWLTIAGISVQPSELAKMAVVIYFSATISKKREKMQTWSQGIWPYVLILGVIALLMMREPHLSGTILIVCTGIVLMIVGGIKGWLIPLGIGGVGLVGTLYVILVQKGILHYGENRINTWRDPFNAEWYRGDGWQIAQCLIAIGSGGLLGVGLGKGRQKFLYLPEEHNDCIFAVICEELGLVGACVIMLVFALLILRGFWIALHARDRFGALLVVGFMTLTGLQTFLNIAVVTGLVPATGISLPFFSYGGTALLCQLAEMGIVLSVSRQMPAPENG